MGKRQHRRGELELQLWFPGAEYIIFEDILAAPVDEFIPLLHTGHDVCGEAAVCVLLPPAM